MGLLDQIQSFAQGASNGVAGSLTGPVDGLAWLLRKAGVPVPQAPLGGSDWMRNVGLMQEPKERMAGLLGEGIGSALPAVIGAKAPQIARGLLSVADNIAAPTTLNKHAGVILFHGSNAGQPIRKVTNGGVFGGLFASPSENAAASHGRELYRMTVPDSAVMQGAGDVDWDAALKTANQTLAKGTSSDVAAELADMALYNKSAWNASIDEGEMLKALRASDVGEADWALQALRGQIAKSAGFRAVSMPDEHGMSYLVLPGATPRPFNEPAKALYHR